MATQSGIHKATLSRWEAGRRQPSVPELEAVLDALGDGVAVHRFDRGQESLATRKVSDPEFASPEKRLFVRAIAGELAFLPFPITPIK